MDWLLGFLEELAKPAWAAELLQATIATAIAFLGAYWLVRRQLLHDRKLTIEQYQRERTDADAARRSAIAYTIGTTLLSLYYDYRDGDVEEHGRQLLQKEVAPGIERAIQLVRTTATGMTDLLLFVDQELNTFLTIWKFCRDQAEVDRKQEPGASMDEAQFAEFAGLALMGEEDLSLSRIFTIGTRLQEWDGRTWSPEMERTGYDEPVETDPNRLNRYKNLNRRVASGFHNTLLHWHRISQEDAAIEPGAEQTAG